MGTAGNFQAEAAKAASICSESNLVATGQEWDSVVPSTISSSPPTGTPWAIRLASTPYCAHSSAM